MRHHDVISAFGQAFAESLRAATGLPPPPIPDCHYHAGCNNPATTTIFIPTIGRIHICDDCEQWLLSTREKIRRTLMNAINTLKM